MTSVFLRRIHHPMSQQLIEVSAVERLALFHAMLRACLMFRPERYIEDTQRILGWPRERVIENLGADTVVVNKTHAELHRGRFAGGR